MSNTFKPTDYEVVPQSNSDFMKLKDWENKFRVLSELTIWYETWVEEDGKKKPVRYRKKLNKEPDNILIWKFWPQFNKYFRAFIVWDYNTDSIKFFQLDKRKVLQDLENYLSDEDKNDFRKFDIIITKSGSWDDIKYLLRLKDNKELDKNIKKEWDAIKKYIDLGLHFEWKYVLTEAKKSSEEDNYPF